MPGSLNAADAVLKIFVYITDNYYRIFLKEGRLMSENDSNRHHYFRNLKSYSQEGENFQRLIKPKKGGLMRIIFSRFLIFAVLIILQVGLLLWFLSYARDKTEHYLAIERIFAFIMIMYLFSSSMDASAKLTWMFLISLAPVAGAGVLAYTKVNLGNRAVKRETKKQIENTKDFIEQPEGILGELSYDGSHTDDLVRYLNRSGCFPAYKNTETVFYPIGEEMFESMLRELETAEKFIFLEFFIIEEGYMWGQILNTLIRKAEEGVVVKVMYDGMCELSTLSADYARRLEAVGIEAKPFSPLLPLMSSHYNYRDHRKILVIDGKTAFTGGVNLADEYINRIERFGHWKDTGIMLKGDAVKSFTLMFLQMWNTVKGSADYDAFINNVPEYDPPDSSGYVIPYCDCPLDDDKVGESVYMDILNRAGSYVHIMSPYLVLDGELETALCYAAERGVDVKLILPGKPDKITAYSLAKTHYHKLYASGVKLYEYVPGFVHAKLFVSDDIKAVVGTINLDYRSLYHHFECAAYLYKTDCIKDIEKDFQETLKKCRAVSPQTVKEDDLKYKIIGPIMKFVAPLM